MKQPQVDNAALEDLGEQNLINPSLFSGVMLEKLKKALREAYEQRGQRSIPKPPGSIVERYGKGRTSALEDLGL
ncbi:MAG: hypothetical protein WC433_01950 [Candidatus Omnitrophota bacterium]